MFHTNLTVNNCTGVLTFSYNGHFPCLYQKRVKTASRRYSMGQAPPEILRMETIASTFPVQDMHLF